MSTFEAWAPSPVEARGYGGAPPARSILVSIETATCKSSLLPACGPVLVGMKLSLLFQGVGDSRGAREDTPGFREQLAGGNTRRVPAPSLQGERGLRPCESQNPPTGLHASHIYCELQDHAGGNT